MVGTFIQNMKNNQSQITDIPYMVGRVVYPMRNKQHKDAAWKKGIVLKKNGSRNAREASVYFTDGNCIIGTFVQNTKDNDCGLLTALIWLVQRSQHEE